MAGSNPGGWVAAQVAHLLCQVEEYKNYSDARRHFAGNCSTLSKRYRLQGPCSKKLDVIKITGWNPLDAIVTDGFSKLSVTFEDEAEPPASLSPYELPQASLCVWDFDLQIGHSVTLLINSATWTQQGRIGKTWAGPLQYLNLQNDARALVKHLRSLREATVQESSRKNPSRARFRLSMARNHAMIAPTAKIDNDDDLEPLATQAPFLNNAYFDDKSSVESQSSQASSSADANQITESCQPSTSSKGPVNEETAEKREKLKRGTANKQPKSFGHNFLHSNNFKFTNDFAPGVGIPPDQQSLLRKPESWYHPEPGKQHVSGYVPIETLQEVKERIEKQDRSRARLLSRQKPQDNHVELSQMKQQSASKARLYEMPAHSAGSTAGSPSWYGSSPIPWSPSQHSLLPLDSSAVQKSPSVLSRQLEREPNPIELVSQEEEREEFELEDSDPNQPKESQVPREDHVDSSPNLKQILVGVTQTSEQLSREENVPLDIDDMDAMLGNQPRIALPEGCSAGTEIALQHMSSDEGTSTSRNSHKRRRDPASPSPSKSHKTRRLDTESNGFLKTLERQSDRVTSPELGTDDADCSTRVVRKGNIPTQYELEDEKDDISAEALELFSKFTWTYKPYAGNFKHFQSRCLKIKDLYRRGRLRYKLWDDFVIQHQSSYRDHCSDQLEAGDDPKPYERFLQEDVKRTYSYEILNPVSMNKVFGLNKSSPVQNTISKVESTPLSKPISLKGVSRPTKHETDKGCTSNIWNVSKPTVSDMNSKTSDNHQISSMSLKHVQSRSEPPEQFRHDLGMNVKKEKASEYGEDTKGTEEISRFTQERSVGQNNVGRSRSSQEVVQSRSVESIRSSPFHAIISNYRKSGSVKNAMETPNKNKQSLKSVNIPQWEN